MFLKKSLFVMLLATFILAAACGGAEKSHDAMAEPDPMSDTEPRRNRLRSRFYSVGVRQ